jgi:hypothetical protein
MSRQNKVICLSGILALCAVATWTFWYCGILGLPEQHVKHFDSPRHKIPEVANGPWGEMPVDKIPVLVGATIEKVREQFGAPNHENEFPVDGGLPEFRVELLNTYPPGDPRSRGVRIREWRWQYPGFRVAIWFHRVEGEWIVLDTVRWRNGVEF